MLVDPEHGTIRVGDVYQAVLPPHEASPPAGAAPAAPGEEKLWAPAAHVAPDDVAAFLRRARGMVGAPGSGGASTGDDAALLRVFYECGYDGDDALLRVAAERSTLAGAPPWDSDDVDAFTRAVAAHGDDLAALRAALPHKTRAEIVARYFRVVVDRDGGAEATAGARRSSRLQLQDEANALGFLQELRAAVGAQVFGTVLKQLRMYDQRIIDAKRLELNISRLLDADRDADIAAAFKYFLPLPEEEEE